MAAAPAAIDLAGFQAPMALSGSSRTTADPAKRDRRQHKRVELALLGRFMRSTRQEYPCKLVNISVGGAALMSPVPVDDGERIVAYFDHLGGIEGHVVRTFDGGIAIRIAATQHKREKLAAQLTWLINRNELGPDAGRRHERCTLPNVASRMTLPSGATVPCHIIDVSVSGASLRTDLRPQLGQDIMLGRLRGRIIRHHDSGVAVQFLDVQGAHALRRHSPSGHSKLNEELSGSSEV
jgi:hypothetical protein